MLTNKKTEREEEKASWLAADAKDAKTMFGTGFIYQAFLLHNSMLNV